nr:hypothetical protein [Actinomyces succiniciruminis]
MNLAGGIQVLVPGGGDVDAELGEDLLVVEHGHRAGVQGQAVYALTGVNGVPRPLGERALVVGGAELRQIRQGLGDGELLQGVVLDLGYVGPALAG